MWCLFEKEIVLMELIGIKNTTRFEKSMLILLGIDLALLIFPHVMPDTNKEIIFTFLFFFFAAHIAFFSVLSGIRPLQKLIRIRSDFAVTLFFLSFLFFIWNLLCIINDILSFDCGIGQG